MATAWDFKRDGSRTVVRRRWLGLALWLEESAAWHRYRSAYYGGHLHRSPGWTALEVQFGRWSIHVVHDRLAKP